MVTYMKKLVSQRNLKQILLGEGKSLLTWGTWKTASGWGAVSAKLGEWGRGPGHFHSCKQKGAGLERGSNGAWSP